MTNTATLIKKHSNMSNALTDLIRITIKESNYRKKEDPTDDSEVMTSEDDDNPEGDQSTDNDFYEIFVDPELMLIMKRKKAKTLRIVKNRAGGRRMQILFQ